MKNLSPTRILSIITAIVAVVGQIMNIWQLPFTDQISQTLNAIVGVLAIVLGANTVTHVIVDNNNNGIDDSLEK